MNANPLLTKRLELILPTVEEALAGIDAMSDAEKEHLSADWLARVRQATEPDPWVHGFSMKTKVEKTVIGSCGFKGPPSSDGVVEIAYSVHPDHQGLGYATEAAAALVCYAFTKEEVHVVCAHTLPESNASGRVLTKCGFKQVGEIMDPEDGLVWRWEISPEADGQADST